MNKSDISDARAPGWLLFLSLPFFYTIKGWVLTILWGWFMVPYFKLPALGLIQAIGLVVVGVVMFGSYTSNKDVKITDVISYIMLPLFYLLIGWVVHSFM